MMSYKFFSSKRGWHNRYIARASVSSNEKWSPEYVKYYSSLNGYKSLAVFGASTLGYIQSLRAIFMQFLNLVPAWEACHVRLIFHNRVAS